METIKPLDVKVLAFRPQEGEPVLPKEETKHVTAMAVAIERGDVKERGLFTLITVGPPTEKDYKSFHTDRARWSYVAAPPHDGRVIFYLS